MLVDEQIKELYWLIQERNETICGLECKNKGLRSEILHNEEVIGECKRVMAVLTSISDEKKQVRSRHCPIIDLANYETCEGCKSVLPEPFHCCTVRGCRETCEISKQREEFNRTRTDHCPYFSLVKGMCDRNVCKTCVKIPSVNDVHCCLLRGCEIDENSK